MHIIEYPCVPFETPIFGGFNHDAKIQIHGEPHLGHHNGFVVNLPSHEGIALHISVRMGHCGENVIVLNSLRHGCWGHEERHHNVFHCGHHFHMKIKCHHSHFSIHVNGHHVAHYHHRQPPHSIRALEVTGDVRIEKIHFEHFHGHNGGGVQIGGGIGMGVVPAPVVMPPPIVMPPPRPVVVAPPPIIAPPPVVVVEEGYHHHHHGPLHHLFHHHHHHCD